MSDSYIRLIPTDPVWQPDAAGAAAAVAYVGRLFAEPGDSVEAVEATFYEKVTLVDAGENTTDLSCGRCGKAIGLDWYTDLAEETGGTLGHLDVQVPCCNAVVPLPSVHFDWPVGFARFEVSARNATRAKYELDADELMELAGVLGHPVAQVLAHY
ncbi:MAG TPA: hypothetical protein VFJ85_05535 [Acidimicrobiales bacterium]|nr:hypothetical protein [Acidimicrobiales bacterium]